MSDDKEQPESDGLDALASGLPATEADEADEELDLATLAAVAGARVTSAGEQNAPSAAGTDKLQLAGVQRADSLSPKAADVAPTVHAAPAAPAAIGAPPAAAARSMLVPVLALLAVGLGVGGYLIGRSSRSADPVEAPAASAPENTGPSDLPAEQPRPAASAAAAAEPVAPSAAAPAAAPAASSVDARSRAAVRSTPPAAKPVASAPAPAPVPGPAEPVVAEPAAKPGEPAAALAKVEPVDRSMDQLLDDALEGAGELSVGGGRRPAAPAALPEAPSREEVTQAMAVLLPAIRGCAMGQTGLATAGIVVRGDGRVASVELTGAPFEGTASGRCMEGVLRRARFSRFRQPTFRVRFPFAIQ